jgi:homoserine kinase
VISPVAEEDIVNRPNIKLFEISQKKKRNIPLIAGMGVTAAAIIGGILAHTPTNNIPTET